MSFIIFIFSIVGIKRNNTRSDNNSKTNCKIKKDLFDRFLEK